MRLDPRHHAWPIAEQRPAFCDPRELGGAIFEACEALIQRALDAQAPDNVSVGVVAVVDADLPTVKPGRTTQETPRITQEIIVTEPRGGSK